MKIEHLPETREAETGLSYREVADVLRLVRESAPMGRVDIRIGELRLSLTRRTGAAPAAQSAPVEPAAASGPAAAPAPSPARPASTSGTPVTAPMLGVFYRAASPDAPPFVQVGDVVGENDTVGLIEAMKLFTPIPAGIAGRVAEVLVDNGALVEHRQPLILIAPA